MHNAYTTINAEEEKLNFSDLQEALQEYKQYK